MFRSTRTMLMSVSLALLASITASPHANAKDNLDVPGGGTGGGSGACWSCNGGGLSGSSECVAYGGEGSLIGQTSCQTSYVVTNGRLWSTCFRSGPLCIGGTVIPTSPGYI